uniref:T9SS type A sorting domain-containing protein n=1 Tax=uncultured Maribacter sp. TaxID=431308 RepID=UPI00260B8283
EINVAPFDCNSLGLQTSYSVNNGAFVNGSSNVTITEGDDITLSLLPNATPFSIDGPNTKPLNTDSLIITNATATDDGTYTYTTTQGCTISLEINVAPFDCNSLGLQTSYSVNNGAFVSEEETVFLSITVGDDLRVKLNLDNIPFSVSGHKTKKLNEENFIITDAQISDIGSYHLTTKEGCNKLLVLNVQKLTTTSNAKLEDIIVYPNPVPNGKVKFVLKDFLNETINVNFYDIYGKLVNSYLIPSNHEDEEELNISILSTGTYIVEIVRINKGESIYKKVIKLQ